MPFIVDSNAETKQEIRDVCAITIFAAFADGDTFPTVSAGGTFKTANTTPTALFGFGGGYNGQRINVVFNDTNTTVSFIGTIRGNNGNDWHPIVGDSMVCTFDGSLWYAIISTTTSNVTLGTYQLWVDFTGDLRINDGTPSSDIDGTIVGFTFVEGSIYTSTKDSLTTWLDEDLASGVNIVKIENVTQITQIGFVANTGDTPSVLYTVSPGEIIYIRTTNSRIAWKSVAIATLDITQSVAK